MGGGGGSSGGLSQGCVTLIVIAVVILAGLRELTAPVVAINPDARPTDTEALRRHGVKTVLMSGVGHFLMMEDPDRFNRLLGEVVEEFRG